MKIREATAESPAAVFIRGCFDCPFAEDFWAGCTHPQTDAVTSLAVSGITDARLKQGHKPRGCPLRRGPLLVGLRPKKRPPKAARPRR